MTKNVSGIFKTSIQAREALLGLERAGFTEDKISIVATDESLGSSFTLEKESKAAEGAGIGATAGGLLGAVAAGLAAAGAVAIPGLNLLVYGPIIAAAAGMGAGATIGGLTGALIGLGIPEYEAKRFEKEVRDGSVLIVVDVKDNEQEKLVKKLFERTEATKIAA